MTRTGDQAFVKELNLSIVLNVLRFQGTVSRTQIAKLTGLNKATISSLVDELITKQLVIEVGRAPSQVGRRPILLLFNANAGFALGIDLEVDFVRVVATDLSGQIVQTQECSLTHPEHPQSVLGQLVEQIQTLVGQLPPTPFGVVGIGVGVPGLVDYRRGIVINAPNLGWRDIHLKALLESYVNLPVYVDNEANAGALGEKMRGAGRDVSDLVYISAGVGIGVGIIVNHELIRGAQGMAGEFGHMTVEPQGLRCGCGNQGCWEMYASEKALVDQYRRLSGRSLNSAAILSLVAENENFALESLQSIGQYLGIGIANILNGLNPSLVIIGNRLGRAGDRLLGPVLHTVQSRCFIAPYSEVKIQMSALGLDTCAIGAASLVLHEYFAGPLGQVHPPMGLTGSLKA
ncbi:ROK family transcriptional regulator [Alicyclobacillaceae bacterium I2511]|nr:ROK family transcriptional regulator [Alicyclobacillaceae bacterium I2511]